MAKTPRKKDELHYERPVLPHEREADPAVRAGGMATAGIEFAIVVGIFLGIGWWLDGKLGTEPWFLVGMTLAGVAAAMTLLIRQATRMNASPRNKADKGDRS